MVILWGAISAGMNYLTQRSNFIHKLLKTKVAVLFLLTRGGTLSTYPTVVIVTIAHQAPSRIPSQKDEGNWRWFAL